MRTILVILFSVLSLFFSGCSVQVTKPTLTGPDFTIRTPQKSCTRETSTSTYGGNGYGSNSTAETETCRWIDSQGRICTSQTTWATNWTTSLDRKTGKNVTKPDRRQSTSSNCR